MHQNSTRSAAAAVVVLTAFSFGACQRSDPSVRPSLALIRESLQQGRHREAGSQAQALLRRLEEAGRGDSLEAADTIDLLRRAAWLERGCPDPYDVSLCRRAIGIRESHGQVDDPGYATSLNSYAVCMVFRGDYRAAKPYFERALKIRQQMLDPSDPDLVRSLSNLGGVDMELGDYASARPLLERVLPLMEKSLGPAHSDVGTAHFNLGLVLELLGDYEAARSHYEWILGKPGKKPDGTALGGVLVHLGIVQNETGDPVGAERLYRRALRVYEATTGAETKDVAWILSELGILKVEAGDPGTALPLFERACRIRQKVNDDPGTAGCLVLLADLLTDRGEMERAADLYDHALAIQTRVFGPEGLPLAPGLIGYARLHQKLGRFAPALDLALRAEAIARAKFQQTARGLSQREALRYELIRESGIEVALSVLVAAPSSFADAAVARVWDAVVRSRALVLDEMAARQQSLRAAQTSGIEPLLSQLDAARNQLARYTAGSEEATEEEGLRKRIQQAQQEEERLERAVASKSSKFQQRMTARNLGLVEVIAALPPGSALVSYVKYGRPAGPHRAGKQSAYAALVAVAGQKSLWIIPIGGVVMVDSLIERWRKTVSSPPRGSLVKVVPNRNTGEREVGRRLRQVLWDRLPKPAREAQRVFVVPDGNVHLVNFAALPDEKGAYLLDSGPLLHYFSAERDLARHPHAAGGEGGFLVMGAPRFDDDSRGSACPQEDDAPRVRAVRFQPLPASLEEAKEVSKLLASWIGASGEAHFLAGGEATEEAFKRLAAGRRVIHLATHAFATGGDATNRLQRSGVVFAGANRRRCGNTDEDEILTPEEIVSLDLSTTEWIVLSACDTGIGPIQAGEGVQGLRRAFEVAGAGTLIMSLWATEDEATGVYMKQLYRSRLKGMSWPEALRQASLSLIAARREAGLSDDPYYWGAFVAVGDWR